MEEKINLKIYENYIGNVMTVEFSIDTSNSVSKYSGLSPISDSNNKTAISGIFMKVEGFLETNCVREKIWHSKTITEEKEISGYLFEPVIEGKVVFKIHLDGYMVPSFNFKHFSVEYVLDAIVLEKKEKRYFTSQIDIDGPNIKEETKIVDFDKFKLTETSYQKLKKEACKSLLLKYNSNNNEGSFLNDSNKNISLTENLSTLTINKKDIKLARKIKVIEFEDDQGDQCNINKVDDQVDQCDIKKVDDQVDQCDIKKIENDIKKIDENDSIKFYRQMPEILNLSKERVYYTLEDEKDGNKIAIINLPEIGLNLICNRIEIKLIKEDIQDINIFVLEEYLENGQVIDAEILLDKHLKGNDLIESSIYFRPNCYTVNIKSILIRHLIKLRFDSLEVSIPLTVGNIKSIITTNN